MKLGIIGCGAIGTDVALAADKMSEIEQIFLHDINQISAQKLRQQLKKGKVATVAEFIQKVDVVFEGASQEAVEQYAETILSAGIDFIVMSVGSLFDDQLRNKLIKSAREHRCKMYIPSGAVCGIDGLMSASVDVIDEVTLVTTKPPASLGKKYTKRTVVFDGVARQAVTEFPKNINVAASVSLAGIGFDRTNVKIVADPVATRINHKILAHGKFGRLRAEVENMPNPKNPKSSYMASLSAIATLKRIVSPIQIGV
ncbi:MAG: aspartate dehydrogenase [Candidatus Thermoplasmatota archaeon]|nr:aspartate dehydrogenase [Candidatus Thermoplasmatota archaeon]MBU1942001.1 aspartate dehydrogenase [Candidatus Thermoplasmatota archaeon]